MLFVCRFSDQNVYEVRLLIPQVIIFPLDATNASFIMGFIVLVLSRRETASQYGEGHNISVSLEVFGQS